jgi:hypothetical protein
MNHRVPGRSVAMRLLALVALPVLLVAIYLLAIRPSQLHWCATSEETTPEPKMLGGITGKGFMPGVSGNPSGRPRKPITEAYADMTDQKVPDDPQGRTYARLTAEGQYKAAIKGIRMPRARLLTGWKAKLFNRLLGISAPA